MSDQTTKPEGVEEIRLWDPALRLFHWALVVCVVTAWGLGQFGPSIMTLHFYFGYAVAALLAFRVIWGLFGPASARFSHFLYGPGATLRYAAQIGRRAPSYWPGHSPLGALSVFALLAVLMAQVGTGLYADPDDFINVGPLADTISREAAIRSAGWHHRLSLVVLLLVLLHLAAILFYRLWKRENLVRPMITGRKAVRRDRQA